jgi:hypothetical protein
LTCPQHMTLCGGMDLHWSLSTQHYAIKPLLSSAPRKSEQQMASIMQWFTTRQRFSSYIIQPIRRPKWCNGYQCWLLVQRSRARIPGKSWSCLEGLALHWQSILLKINHVSNDLYAELKKSSTYSHTWLGLNTQIGRPRGHRQSLRELSRIVDAIGLFFLHIRPTAFLLESVWVRWRQRSDLTSKKIWRMRSPSWKRPRNSG